MGSTSPMSRGNKRKQLKRQIAPPSSPFQEEEDSWEVMHKAYRRVVKKHLIILAVLAALTATTALVLSRHECCHTFTDYQTIWERNPVTEAQGAAARGGRSFYGYRNSRDGVLKCTKDGVTYPDAKGRVAWIQNYEMKSPVVSVNGDFVAIGDQQGNSIYIRNQNRTQGRAITLPPILGVMVPTKGVVTVLQEDSKANYIHLYKKDGSPLDIMMRSLLSGDGYPMDLSFSLNGTQLVTSYMYLDQDMIEYKVAFYNFDLGKNGPNRVVNMFSPKDLGDVTVGKVRLLDESYSVIFPDKGIQLLSTRTGTSPELVSQVPIGKNIQSISHTQDRVGIVTDNMEGGDPYRLRIYDREGNPVFEEPFGYQYTDFDIDGDLILLYNDSSCKVYNMIGMEKYNGTSGFTASKVSARRFPETLLVMEPQRMTEIRLQ